MSRRAINALLDGLDWDYFNEAFMTWPMNVRGADHFGMYCAGHEL